MDDRQRSKAELERALSGRAMNQDGGIESFGDVMNRFGSLIACAALVSASTMLSVQALGSGETVPKVFSDLLADATTELQVFEAHGFKVQSSKNNELGADFAPTGESMDLLLIQADGMFKVAVEKGRSQSSGGGLAVFHRATGAPMVSLGDSDGDGAVDAITYTVVDENGGAVMDVVDYEADGQADLRIHFGEDNFELWHNDRWYWTEQRDGVRGIVVDDDFHEIRNIENRPVVR